MQRIGSTLSHTSSPAGSHTSIARHYRPVLQCISRSKEANCAAHGQHTSHGYTRHWRSRITVLTFSGAGAGGAGVSVAHHGVRVDQRAPPGESPARAESSVVA